VHADDRDKFAAALARLTNPGEVEVECRMRKSSGADVYVRSLISCGADEPGIVRGVSIDLTAQKKLEEELRQAQKLESVGRLAAGIAHEINTPVQFVNDNVHFLKEAFSDLAGLIQRYRDLRDAVADGQATPAMASDIADAEEAADLSYVLESAPTAIERSIDGLGRIATIVRSMKEFAHPDRKEMTTIDLNQALSSTLTIARNEYKYVASVETRMGAIPPVTCYAGEINQVFLNILVNAAHAIGDVVKGTDQKGRITVTTRREGADVLISISDTGGGIPEQVRDRIFDPFFTTKEVGKGTGQGLAIARAVVVEKHGGEIAVETEVGKGTTFVVRLPIDGKTAADVESDAHAKEVAT